MTTSKPLEKLTKEEYSELKAIGYLYEFFPHATGSWERDTGSNTKGLPESLQAPTSALEQQVDGSHYIEMKMQPVELAYALGATPCFCKLAKYLTREKGDKLTNFKKALHCIKLEEQLVGEGAFSYPPPDNSFQAEDHLNELVGAFSQDGMVRRALGLMYWREYDAACRLVEEIIVEESAKDGKT